jgi:hypothetical protein
MRRFKTHLKESSRPLATPARPVDIWNGQHLEDAEPRVGVKLYRRQLVDTDYA